MMAEFQRTALHAAAASGSAQCVTSLLAAGARADSKDLFGQTPLHSAARAGEAECVKALLGPLLDPNTTDAGLNTSLHLAAASGSRGAFDALLSGGASLTAANKEGRTPLDEIRSEALLSHVEERLRTAAPPGEAAAAAVRSFFASLSSRRLDSLVRSLARGGSPSAWNQQQRKQAEACLRDALRQAAEGGAEGASRAASAVAKFGISAAGILAGFFGGDGVLGTAVAEAAAAQAPLLPPLPAHAPAAAESGVAELLQKADGGLPGAASAIHALLESVKERGPLGPAAAALDWMCELDLGGSPESLPQAAWELVGSSAAEHAARALLRAKAAAAAADGAKAAEHGDAAFGHAVACLFALRHGSSAAAAPAPPLVEICDKVARRVLRDFRDTPLGGRPSSAADSTGAAAAAAEAAMTATQLWALERKDGGKVTAIDDLLKLIGLEEVKLALYRMFQRRSRGGQVNLAKEQGDVPPFQNLNARFEGNPGTGKTTVARIYADFLMQLGVLPDGAAFEETSGSELATGGPGAPGTPATATAPARLGTGLYRLLEAMKEARGSPRPRHAGGGVIFVDEAYQLNPDSDGGGRRVLDMLLPHMTRLEGVYGKDYDDDALIRIMRKRAGAVGVTLAHDLAVLAVGQLARAKAMPNFGNAGAVKDRGDLNAAIFRMESRLGREQAHGSPGGPRSLAPEDFEVPADGAGQTAEQIFDSLVGCDEVRELVKGLRSTILYAKASGDDPKTKIEYNYLLVGNPGTGKTTVAWLMGKVFKSFGLLPFDSVVEVDASKLQTGYVGQAGKMMTETLAKAKGKVLFIDEAYALNPKRGGPFMTEVVDTLTAALTSVEFEGKLVVVLGGYEKGENNVFDMLRCNSGLSGRFTETIRMRDLSDEACTGLLHKKLAAGASKLRLSPEGAAESTRVFQELAALPGWANGRDVDALVKKLYKRHANRVADALGRGVGASGESLLECALCAEDVRVVGAAVADERRARAAAQVLGEPAGSAHHFASASADAAPPRSPVLAEEIIAQAAAPKEKDKPSVDPAGDASGSGMMAVIDDIQKALPNLSLEEYARVLRECAEGRPRGELLVGLAGAEAERRRAELQQQCAAAEAVLAAQEESDAAAEEQRKRDEEAAERLSLEAERLREQARLASEAERARLEELARKAEAERQAREEKAKAAARERQVQEKLRQMGVCCMGFQWLKIQGGYVCAGGSHNVSDRQLGM